MQDKRKMQCIVLGIYLLDLVVVGVLTKHKKSGLNVHLVKTTIIGHLLFITHKRAREESEILYFLYFGLSYMLDDRLHTWPPYLHMSMRGSAQLTLLDIVRSV